MIVRQKIVIPEKEKTIVDALDHPEYCGGIEEVAKCLWNAKDDADISFEKILKYAKKNTKQHRNQKIGISDRCT